MCDNHIPRVSQCGVYILYEGMATISCNKQHVAIHPLSIGWSMVAVLYWTQLSPVNAADGEEGPGDSKGKEEDIQEVEEEEEGWEVVSRKKRRN